jgi:hypothetical protein
VGERGPVPKREEERRRRNKKPKATKPAEPKATKPPRPPKPDKDWHPVAKRFFNSLAASGQSEFYEASDWAMAYVLAESMSRDLEEQVVAVPEKTGEPVYAKVPMKGASLSAYLKGMAALMMSEAERRRAGVELERGKVKDPETPAGVTAISDYRKSIGA